MTEWQPLSVRRGLRPARGPQDGVPGYLQGPLLQWLESSLRLTPTRSTADARASAIALVIGLEMKGSLYISELVNAAKSDGRTFLDIIDQLLADGDDGVATDALENILERGGSMWRVREDGKGLTERVPEAAADAYQLAVSPTDVAAEHLKQAWDRVYGADRSPDTAWGEAIKACEAAFIPIVTPKNAKANLGSVIGQLNNDPHVWDFRLVHYPSRETALPALVQMLKIIWIDPNRHAGQPASRPATQEEAENIVSLAVTLVSWARTGVLKRRP